MNDQTSNNPKLHLDLETSIEIIEIENTNTNCNGHIYSLKKSNCSSIRRTKDKFVNNTIRKVKPFKPAARLKLLKTPRVGVTIPISYRRECNVQTGLEWSYGEEAMYNVD